MTRCVLLFLIVIVAVSGCSRCSSSSGTGDASSDAAKPSSDAASSDDRDQKREEAPKRALSLDVRGDIFSAAAYSADGRWLATGGDDAFVWDRATFELVAILPGGSNHMDAIAWSPDSQRIAVIGEGIRVFDLAAARSAKTAKDVKPLAAHKPEGGNVTETIAWSADGSAVDFVSGDGMIGSLSARASASASASADASAQTGKLTKSVRADAKTLPAIGSAVFTKDHSRVIASEHMSGKIFVVNATSGAIIQRFAPPPSEEAILSFELDPSGKRLLVVYNGENAFRIFDVGSGAETAKIPTKETRIEQAVWSPDGTAIAVAGFGGFARLFDVATMRESAVLGPHPRSVDSVAWSADGKEVAVLTMHATLWSVGGGGAGGNKPTLVRRSPSFRIAAEDQLLACSADGRAVAIANIDYGAFVFHTDSGEHTTFPDQVRILDNVRTTALAVTPDASRVSTVDTKGAIVHWDIATKTRAGAIELADYRGFPEFRRPLVSPDGRHIAALPPRSVKDQDGGGGFTRERGHGLSAAIAPKETMFVWSLDSGAVESRASGHVFVDDGTVATWSPKSDVIAVSSSAGHVAIIDAKTGARAADLELTLPGFFTRRSELGGMPTVPIVFTSDGQKILTVGAKTTDKDQVGVDLWRISTRAKEPATAISSSKLTLQPSMRAMPGEKWIAGGGAIYDATTGARVAWIEGAGGPTPSCGDPRGRWVVLTGSPALLFMRPDGTWLTIDIVPIAVEAGPGAGWATVAIASDGTFDAPASLLTSLHFNDHEREVSAQEISAARREGLAKAWLARP